MKVFISGSNCYVKVLFLKEGKVDQFFIDQIPPKIYVGNIYKGKIERIVKGLNAGFVNTGEPENGFLHFDEKEVYYGEEDFRGFPYEVRPHRVGEEIIVQVTKPGKELKGMKLTTKITLPGKYLVLFPESEIKTVSKRIGDREERKRLMNAISRVIPRDIGFIIRTYAKGKPEKYIIKEAKTLLKEWQRIKKISKKVPAPSLLWKELPLHLKVLRDFIDDDIKEILVEGTKFYNEVKSYLQVWSPGLIKKLRFYREKIPLFKKYNLNKKIMEFLTDKVNLPSGGYLLIEEGSTLTAIDVNSGSFESENYSQTIYNTNLEAAVEIPRQIRVRNLSGLIIIDFIDMKEKDKREEVFKRFKKNLEAEKARIKILSLSELGLVEMSRERTGITLREFFFAPCKKCNGKGYVKNLNYLTIELEEEIYDAIYREKNKRFVLKVSPDIYEFISKNSLFQELIERKKLEIEPVFQFDSDEYFKIEVKSK